MIQNTLITFTFRTPEERNQIIAANQDKILVGDYDLPENKSLVFNDNAQEKYIKSLEDQLLLLSDELSGGIL
ncbi:hypothetical protein HQN90_20440 [Paenibacillus alba]|uniref:hypothetical protein n=1 Tax=Paenibacillus alba TaxID=1197127 RepID=UPI001566D290|nr:hypothetical protein [Paenibacillus alba]NQX67992.1 hypothetical protein [Paenibacillus alba]NQX68498.1 hypothetical protein [Paenibacillus alba]